VLGLSFLQVGVYAGSLVITYDKNCTYRRYKNKNWKEAPPLPVLTIFMTSPPISLPFYRSVPLVYMFMISWSYLLHRGN